MRPLRPEDFLLSPFVREGKTGTTVRGVPGEVGGRERGTELMEWAPRLCVWEDERGRAGGASGVRVFVKVIVTEKGSPAKKEA